MINTRCPKGLRPEPSRDSPFKEGVAAWLFQFKEPDDGSLRAGHALCLVVYVLAGRRSIVEEEAHCLYGPQHHRRGGVGFHRA